MTNSKYFIVFLIGISLFGFTRCQESENPGTVEDDLGSTTEALRTDENVIAREEEAIKIDGLSVAEMKQLRERLEKHAFQAEVNRLMKLIINSLYKNKEIFLRELISNASDALDKIRLLSLTDSNALNANPDLNIKIKADKENNVLHIIDSGVGMTKQELLENLGTIAKSGTSEFFSKFQESKSASEANDLIGQFGVGFYSAFLVADRVVVTTKHNDDRQYIWQSDASEFSLAEDPRGDTLGRGTIISLHLKDEAIDFLEVDTLEALIRKYSQFINFPISLWKSKTETVEEPVEEEETSDDDEKEKTDEKEDDDKDKTEDEEGAVEEEKEEKPKTKKVPKTTWDFELINEAKPIWTRKPEDIDANEYNEFYKALSKDSKDPLTKTHFIAEGEVTFKSLLFVPSEQPSDVLNRYGTKTDNIKLYVRRVFITDDFQDMMPNYLSFIRGIVDSDDLPLNVSRENLQQHKLLKVIKKKLVRKVLDMLKKMEPEEYLKFWKEYSTNIKLGMIEDASNKNRLAKLMRFYSSNSDQYTSLADYVERMKGKQQHIFYMAGSSLKEVKSSPFVERLLNKGYEVLYLVEAVDEYAINAIPEFEGRKFQNVAKEGLQLDEGAAMKEFKEKMEEKFKPLNKWLAETALKEHIGKSDVSERLSESPCALVSSRFGWTANMERIVASQTHSKSNDPQKQYQMGQKKMLEINPRHPLIKELLRRVESDPEDVTAKNIAMMMFRTATLRSGYSLTDTVDFAKSVEEMMRQTLGIPLDEAVDEEPEIPEGEEEEVEEKTAEEEGDDGTEEIDQTSESTVDDMKDEL